MTSASVYRFFDSDGTLLYVGATKCGPRRFSAHEKREWWPDVALIEIEHFDSREEALAHESEWIRSRDPKFNVKGTRFHRRSDVCILYAKVPVALHTALRLRAFKEDRSLSALVRDAVERYLAEVAA